jgi:transposase InsO family protein
VYGLRAIADGVIAMAEGTASRGERERVLRWTRDVRGRGACHHPDGAVRFVQSVLDVFDGEIEGHLSARCRALPAGLPVGEDVALAAAAGPGSGAARSSRGESLWQ